MGKEAKPQKGVLLIPEGTEQRHVGRRRPLFDHSWAAFIFRWRANLWWATFWHGFVSPIFNAGALFAYLLQIPVFWFTIQLLGPKKMTEQLTTAAAAILAFLATLPVWALLNAFLASARLTHEERKLGVWSNTRFLFHQRRHVFTTEWRPENNGEFREFEFRDAPLPALVDYEIEISGPAERVNCLVVGHHFFHPISVLTEGWQLARSGRVKLRPGKKLRLYCHSLPNTIPAIVRVYVVAFEFAPSIRMEYTENRTQARMVVTDENGASSG